jgi:hypothetical protein
MFSFIFLALLHAHGLVVQPCTIVTTCVCVLTHRQYETYVLKSIRASFPPPPHTHTHTKTYVYMCISVFSLPSLHTGLKGSLFSLFSSLRFCFSNLAAPYPLPLARSLDC